MPNHSQLIWQLTGVKTMRKLNKTAGFELAVLAALVAVTVATLSALVHAALNIQVIA
jgi:hypothetical protein